LENIDGLDCRKMKPNHINAIAAWSLMVHRVPQMEHWKKKFIKGNLQLNVIRRYQAAYIQMMVLHHVERTHFDPWLTAKILHEMTLLSKEPIYVKQVAGWLKQGLIQPASSKFNSPLYAITCPNRGL
jgi:hypothetical protein